MANAARTGFCHEQAGGPAEYYTPPELFAALGLRFDLDPAAPPGGVPWVPARRYYTAAENGLHQPWQGRVWLNPPYDTQVGRWLERLAAHGDGMALVFARTDTRWWQTVAPTATAVCLIAGRLRFRTPDGTAGPAPAPSACLAFGLPCALALAGSGLGHTLLIPGSAAAKMSFSRPMGKAA
jgi:hypothetical protein